MIVDSLRFRQAHPDWEDCLPPDELLRRVAACFPLAVIDRQRGDRVVNEQADELARFMPETDGLVLRHRGMAGRVAHVTVQEADDGPRFCFLLPHPTVIDVEYGLPEDRGACRPLLEALAAVLPEYDLCTEALDDSDAPEDPATSGDGRFAVDPV